MKKFFLVDVSSMFFRAFYAIRPLTSPGGVPVNAVYGFLAMLTKLLKDESPEYVVFCYDRKEPSFRKDLYDDYKANRSEMPEDLAQQIPYIKKLADLLGVPSMEEPGFEADDLIGTLALWGRDQGFDVNIVSGDKDFGQLVGPGVTLYDTMKDLRYDAAGVKEKWGVRPDQMIDYLALVGDSSDNVPGVAGIGPKGALKLLEQFKDLEEMYANLDKVESKSVREKLAASKDKAFLSKRLVTIVTDVKLPKDPEHYHLKPMDRENLRELLRELGFKTFEKNLLDGGEDVKTIVHASATVKGAAKAAKPAAAPTFAGPAPKIVDLSGPAPVEVVGNAVPFDDRDVTPLGPQALADKLVVEAEAWGYLDPRGIFVASGDGLYLVDGDAKEFGPLADAKKIRWKGFDLKTFWHAIGAVDPIPAWDSMLAAYAIHGGDCSDLGKLLDRHLGASLPEMAPPAQWVETQKQLAEELTERLAEHAADKVYMDLELPLAPVLLRMERRGIKIDRKLLEKESKALEKDIAAVEAEVHRLAGESFNVGSPKQLGVILFEKLGLPAGKKTKTGYSTGAEVLEKIEHPIAAKVLTWRELSKLKSTYVDALPGLADENGRIHTTFTQATTATGRLSSVDPNLQNIPIRTERGRRIREAFIAGEGLSLLSVDYSQIELRILAHISQDPALTRAFADDLDIHAATAAEVFNVPLKEVTADQRRTAKAVNFGIAYGQAAFGLAENLGIPRGEAAQVIERYFEKFKGVREYIESTVKTAHEQGYVETLFGRRRYIEELSSKNQAMRKFGERAAINAPIQGTASDLVRLAMIRLSAKVPLDMLLQVHDELIFEAKKEDLERWIPEILKIMEGAAQLRVPLRANYAIGHSWGEAH